MRRALVAAALALALLVGAAAAWSAWDVARFDVESLARRTPERTALMRQREDEARRSGTRLAIDVRSVAYERISPLLRRAILIAEDDAFFSHGGLDWAEMRASARKNLDQGRVVRGGSTITQQLAKNLFLGSERSLTRKFREAFLAMRIERALTKRRIFELYLNRIEWGRGIFGAEAAARRHFGVPASTLNPRQALLLAAVIINPIRYSVHSPAPRIQGRVKMIAGRMRRRGYLDAAQYREALGLPPELQIPPEPAADTLGWPTERPGQDSSGAPHPWVAEPDSQMQEPSPPPDSIGI
ncbi:MAG: monofunctional biosynthetic peptidoglycan transglycosylase [Candidatus Eisenbacteria bacterium]